MHYINAKIINITNNNLYFKVVRSNKEDNKVMDKMKAEDINNLFDNALRSQNFCDNDTERELSNFDVKDLFKPFTI